MLQFDESYHERDIELPVGDAFAICLPENPTTGFRWSFVSNGEPTCTLLGNSFETTAEAAGSGGSRCWRFQIAQAGHGNIELVYQRAWEREKEPARRFILHVYA